MKSINIVVVSVLLLASSGFVNAESISKSGGYMHATLGFSNMENSDVKLWQNFLGDSEGIDTGFGGVFGGGYRFNQNIALEGGFAVGNGSFDFAGTSNDAQNFTIYAAAVGIYPINDNFELFGKLGLGSTKTTVTWTENGQNYEDKSGNEVGVVYGLGAGYTPTGSGVTWLVEYMNTNNTDGKMSATGSVGVFKSSIFGIGARLKF